MREHALRGGSASVDLAPLSARLLAWWIDTLALTPLLASLWIDIDPTVLLLLAHLWVFAYCTVGWSAIARGQTLGMRVMHIRVVTVDGSLLPLPRAIARYLALLLTFSLMGVPLLLATTTRMRQAMHDLIARTVVVADHVKTEPQGG